MNDGELMLLKLCDEVLSDAQKARTAHVKTIAKTLKARLLDEDEYRTRQLSRLERIVELLHAGEVHMAIAKVLADMSALKSK